MTEFTTWRSLVDGAEISAIPDSAVSQLRLAEGSGTSVSNEFDGQPDATLNGEFWTSNNYEGGFALDFQGTDELDFDDTFDFAAVGEQFSFAVTIDFSAITDEEVIWHQRPIDDDIVTVGWTRDEDEDGIGIGTFDGSFQIEEGSDNTPTGRARLGIAIDRVNQVAEIYWDGVQDTTTSGNRPPMSGDTNENAMGYQPGNNKYIQDGVLDNPIWYNELLSQSEFESDYNSQPWV